MLNESEMYGTSHFQLQHTSCTGAHGFWLFCVQSVSPAVGRCNVRACESMLCSVPLFLFSSVGLYYDSVYSTVYDYLIRDYISIHSVVCLTTAPEPLPSFEFCSLRSSASSFNF